MMYNYLPAPIHPPRCDFQVLIEVNDKCKELKISCKCFHNLIVAQRQGRQGILLGIHILLGGTFLVKGYCGIKGTSESVENLRHYS